MTREEADLKIKELIDDKFLTKLVEVAKLYGWQGDFVEIEEFVHELHKYDDIELERFTPYQLVVNDSI